MIVENKLLLKGWSSIADEYKCNGVIDMKVALLHGLSMQISPVDLELYSRFIWYCNAQGYAVATIEPNGRPTRFHRLVVGCPAGSEVDHIDGDKLNNCRENLRICTHQENMCNSKVRKHNVSRYKGVSQYGKHRAWRASITVDGKTYYSNGHATALEAAKEYDRLAEKYHRVFAKYNLKERIAL